ncbi:ferritin family protein [Thermodesulfobacteriota bacterium]
MADEKNEILRGLKTAMEAELTGYNFYKNAAESTSDKDGKETFGTMAEEEMGHFNFLRHQYRSFLKKGKYDFSKKLTKKQLKHADSPIFSEEIRKRIKDAHFEVSALTIGMKLELDAMNFYKLCAKETDDNTAKQFYSELAEWEEDHYTAFAKALEGLKESYFQANNFVPM